MKKTTKNVLKTIAAFLLLTAMLLSLAACSNNNVNHSDDNTGGSSGNDSNGDNSNIGGPSAIVPAGKNTDNSFSMLASWTESGLINHYDTTTSCNAFTYFVVEGLWNFVRTTDEVFCQLASEMPIHTAENMDNYKDIMGDDVYDFFKENGCDTVTVTTGKIRPEAKWSNGDDFTAKDVWSYYYIVHPTTSNYVAAVNVVDDKTIEFIWNPLKEPVDAVKNLLLAQDISGTVKYDEFAEYVDAAYELVMEGEVNKNINQWGSFSRSVSPEQGEVLGKIRQDFYACDPDWYVSTGPFKLETFSATQILLTKNEYHWAADKVAFDKIKLYSSKDTNQAYQMLNDGVIDYYDGFVQVDTLEQMLAQNKDLINLKMIDLGTVGVIFNRENPIFDDVKVREAFQYVFDRESIKMAANPFAETVSSALCIMPQSVAKANMSPEHFNELGEYSYNTEIASQMLTEAGWEKKDGAWYVNGERVEITLGTDVTWATGNLAAEAAATQLDAFGIKCNLVQANNFWSMSMQKDGPYDMTCYWTTLNNPFVYPTGSYSQFSNNYSRMAHLERYPDDYEDVKLRGQLTLEFEGLDGDTNTYPFADYLNRFYSLDADELKNLVDVINVRVTEMFYGVPFFQNVTASTYNAAKIAGLPLQEYWSEDSNVKYVPPVGEKAWSDVARTNIVWARAYNFTDGVFHPNKAE